jgi:hypothetical protein
LRTPQAQRQRNVHEETVFDASVQIGRWRSKAQSGENTKAVEKTTQTKIPDWFVKSPTAIPALLPTAEPSARLINRHARICGKREVLWNIRSTALHEAAHVYFFGPLLCVELVRASVLPIRSAQGHVVYYEDGHYPFCRRREANAFASACLAGPIASLFMTPRLISPLSEFYMTIDDDLVGAMEHLLGAGASRRKLPDHIYRLWRRTAKELAKPSIWRKVVAIADELIRQEEIPGAALHDLCQLEQGSQTVPDLRWASVRLEGMALSVSSYAIPKASTIKKLPFGTPIDDPFLSGDSAGEHQSNAA